MNSTYEAYACDIENRRTDITRRYLSLKVFQSTLEARATALDAREASVVAREAFLTTQLRLADRILRNVRDDVRQPVVDVRR